VKPIYIYGHNIIIVRD